MKIDKTLLLILLVDGSIWFRSGLGKFTGGNFVAGLPKTLERFASQNPHSWYKDLLGPIGSNSQLWGNLVMYGELAGSVVLLAGVVLGLFKSIPRPLVILMILSLVGLSFMNLNFYLSSGWTSPSSEGLNLLMFSIQIIGAVKMAFMLRGS